MLITRKISLIKLVLWPILSGSQASCFLFDNPHGASASYTTEDSLKDVIFFYESKMLVTAGHFKMNPGHRKEI